MHKFLDVLYLDFPISTICFFIRIPMPSIVYHL